jgi:hypothetical protein
MAKVDLELLEKLTPKNGEMWFRLIGSDLRLRWVMREPADGTSFEVSMTVGRDLLNYAADPVGHIRREFSLVTADKRVAPEWPE